MESQSILIQTFKLQQMKAIDGLASVDDCWFKWVVFGHVTTLGATNDLDKCFFYIPENWYQNHHMPLIKGIWFCTQQFSPVTNGFCDWECGSGPIVLNGFGTLYEIWERGRYASMYKCWTMDLLVLIFSKTFEV